MNIHEHQAKQILKEFGAVVPEGVFAFTVKDLIEKCKKLNLKKILLEVSQGNVNAERFYSRFNFSTVGIRKNYYKDGSDALLKEKKINNKIM